MRHATLFNYVLYQAGWFACILGAAWHRPLTGFGIAVEGAQAWSGTYAQFTSGSVTAWMSPPWLLAMWAQFATTFRFSLHGVMTHPWRATAFGVLGGPIAFLAGERLGAVTLAQPLLPALLRLAVAWGLALYLCARVTRAIAPAETRARYRG